jgi:hypothetical protein
MQNDTVKTIRLNELLREHTDSYADRLRLRGLLEHETTKNTLILAENYRVRTLWRRRPQNVLILLQTDADWDYRGANDYSEH